MAFASIAAPEAPSQKARARELLQLGASLARKGAMVGISIGIAVLTVLGAILLVASAADDGPAAPIAEICAGTSAALAWGAGVLIAFAASAQALRSDRTSGIRALLRARGTSSAAYALGRIGGLAVVLAIIVGGGSLIVGLVSAALASRIGLAGSALQATFASIAYSLAFAATLAPLAMAALGARTRAGGYVWLLLLLVLPELLLPWTSAFLPSAWREVASVPTALAAFRNALMPPSIDILRLVRAGAALALVALFCLALVRREMVRVDAEEAT